MPYNVNIRFFTPDQEALFQKCLAGIPHADNVIVQPLERVGFSGARVFAFFPRGEHSHPHVGKIHTKESITREVNGRELAYHFFQEARQKCFCQDADGGRDLAILAVPLVTNEENLVTELKDLLFQRRASASTTPSSAGPDDWFQYPTETILGIYEKLYQRNCRKTFEGVKAIRNVLGAEYEWYLRHNRSERLVKAWLGTSRDIERIEIYGDSLPNPLQLVQRLLKVERNLPVSTVHGDLHPSNVVLDGREDPHLIDFNWCKNDAHILKDFLVMECSIRFFMTPGHLNRTQQKIIDSALLEPTEDKVVSMLDALRGEGLDPETILHFERCAKIVLQLRTHAARACGAQFGLHPVPKTPS
jgi:hypothetical protein